MEQIKSIILFVTLLFFGCKAENFQELEENNSTTIMEAVTDMQTIYNCLAFAEINITDARLYESCFETHFDTSNVNFNILTIHFSRQQNCNILSEGNSLGKLIVKYPKLYPVLLKKTEIAFDNFHTNGNTYNGKISIAYNSIQPSLKIMTLSVDSLMANNAKGSRRIEGSLTLNKYPLETSISGRINTSATTNIYTYIISNTLRIDNDYANVPFENPYYFKAGDCNFSFNTINGTILYGFDTETGYGTQNKLAIFKSSSGHRIGIELPRY